MSKPLRILLIDDSEDDRLLYRRTLKKSAQAYEFTEAEDGAGGQAMIGPSVDCILLDYSLPGYNGVEVLKQIRADHPFVAVVMLTGQGNEAVAVNAMQEGAQNYITKSSITLETLERVILVAVEHCAMQRRIHDQHTSLGIFTRALAHDLKEPVRTIQSFLGLMATTETFTPKGAGYFHHVQRAAERMNALIDTVFFYMRLDGAQRQTPTETTDTNHTLDEARENLSRLISENGATITAVPLPRLHINRTQLLQVLQNLIANAIRHGNPQPRIHVTAGERADAWEIAVSDNGPGIPEDQRRMLFEPFRRLSSASVKDRGMGLGLAICRKIIETNGGAIRFEPVDTGGARFIFSIPKLPGDESQSAATDGMAPEAARAAADARLANLLLIEDNEADVELVKIILMEKNRLRCNLMVAANGNRALDLLEAGVATDHPVDLMLLDINMPGMDGFQVLEKLRSIDELKNVPVAMCTTSNYDQDMERARRLGAIGYMSKPADLEQLRMVLQQIPGLKLHEDQDGLALTRG